LKFIKGIFATLSFVGLPNETVEKNLVRKMFKKISHNRQKSQNIAKMSCGTPKTKCFSAFLSPFPKIIFERGLFRQLQRFAALAMWVLTLGRAQRIRST
jgi:hypothetical protein